MKNISINGNILQIFSKSEINSFRLQKDVKNPITSPVALSTSSYYFKYPLGWLT